MSLLGKATRTVCYIDRLGDPDVSVRAVFIAFKRDILGINKKSFYIKALLANSLKASLFVTTEKQYTKAISEKDKARTGFILKQFPK